MLQFYSVAGNISFEDAANITSPVKQLYNISTLQRYNITT